MGSYQGSKGGSLVLRAEATGPQCIHLWEGIALGAPNSLSCCQNRLSPYPILALFYVELRNKSMKNLELKIKYHVMK